MSSTSSSSTSAKLRVAPPDLHLAVWPARDEPGRTLGLVALVLVMAVSASAVTGEGRSGLFAAAAVLLAGWRRWVPVTFDLGPSGIVETFLGRQRRIPWAVIARWQMRRHGILLLPDADPSPLDPWRGRYVAWNRNRAELLAILEFYLQDRQQR